MIAATAISCALVALGALIGWALHADYERRHRPPVTPNGGHVRRVP